MPRSGPLIALCVFVALVAVVAAQAPNTTAASVTPSDDPYKIKAYQAKVDETEKANDIAQTTAQRYAAHKIAIRRRIATLLNIAGRLQNKLQKAPESERAKLASTLGRVRQRITSLRSHFTKYKQLEMKAEVAAKEAFDILHNYLALVKNATKVQRRDNWLARSGAIATVIEKVAPIDPKPDRPEQVHIQLAGQRRFPNQKMVVNWVTGVPPAGYLHESVVQWSLSRHAMSISSRMSLGRSHIFTDGGVERRNISIHSALIDRMDPETRYYYRVGVRLVPTANSTVSNSTASKLNVTVNQWQYSNIFHFQTFPKLTRAKIQRRSFAQKDITSTQTEVGHSARSVQDKTADLTDSIDEMYKGAFSKLSVGNKEMDERLARKRAKILRDMKRDQREIDAVMGLIPKASLLEEEEVFETLQDDEEPELSVEDEAENALSLIQVSEEEEEGEDGSDDESQGTDENAGSEETENTDNESTEETVADESSEDSSDSLPKLSINEAVQVRREAVLSQEEALKQPPQGYNTDTEFPTVFRGPPNQYRAMPESLKKKLKLKKTMQRKLKQLRSELAKSDKDEKERLQRLYRKLKRSYKALFKKGPKPPQWQARPLAGQPFTARTPFSDTKAAIDVQKSKFGPKTASKHRFGAKKVSAPVPRLPTDPAKPIEIAVYGDMGVQLNPTIKKLYAEIHARQLDMVIHTGDYAYDMHDDSGRLGDTFMNMIEPIAAYVPYMTCTGNHEYPYNYSHYTERFWGLSDYADSGNNHFYSFDVGTVHFVAFNSDAYLHPQLSDLVKRQYEWLEADLARANRRRSLTPFIVMFAHHPMYCSNTQDINECTTQALLFRRGLNGSLYSLEDLLIKHNVDIYISAHEHSYERTYPVFNGKIDTQGQISPSLYRNARFPVHIVAGAAGDIELLDLFDEVWYGPWSVTRSSSYGYGHLTVHNHTHLQWRQFLDEGRGGVDEFWIVKDANWPGMDKSVLTPTHPFSPQTRTCDHYCYATCMGRLKKSNPDQINVRRITECVPQCNCQAEARKGLINVLGQDIVSRRDKIVLK